MVNDLTQPQPEVTLNSLAYALRAVARRMDPEEDVLLLHLTSHGLRNHELSLRHPATPLYALSPLYLRSLLDEVGVRNRVVIVSACFSGGFVGPLSTGDTLVLTAASADRPSYGCGSDSQMTDFSRALYLKALAAPARCARRRCRRSTWCATTRRRAATVPRCPSCAPGRRSTSACA